MNIRKYHNEFHTLCSWVPSRRKFINPCNSNAGKVTTNVYSQGIRFLSEVAGMFSVPLNVYVFVSILLTIVFLTGKPSSSLNQPINSSDKR